MQFSIGVEYAFHSLFYMIDLPEQKVIGIKALAQLHGVSETYLSKIFTKLRKGGIIRSIPGVNGGYELMRPTDQITFWDVIEAVEGASYMFQCAEIRQKNILASPMDYSDGCPCLIKTVMVEAEDEMRNYLRKKTLGWLHGEVSKTFSEDKKQDIILWQKEVSGKS